MRASLLWKLFPCVLSVLGNNVKCWKTADFVVGSLCCAAVDSLVDPREPVEQNLFVCVDGTTKRQHARTPVGVYLSMHSSWSCKCCGRKSIVACSRRAEMDHFVLVARKPVKLQQFNWNLQSSGERRVGTLLKCLAYREQNCGIQQTPSPHCIFDRQNCFSIGLNVQNCVFDRLNQRL